MADNDDLRPIAEAAERAAAAGDFASAERLLREVAARQEIDLGPLDPELAHTLNNLAVVCERTGKPDDAERFFRRARAIAAASLPPDHPFVATSQQNLREFCEARDLQVDLPIATARASVEPESRPGEGMRIHLEGPPRRDARPLTSSATAVSHGSRRSPRRTAAVAALAAGGCALLLFIATRACLGPSVRTPHAPAARDQSVAGRPERASEPATPVRTPPPGDRAKGGGNPTVSRNHAGTTAGSAPAAPASVPVRELDHPAPQREAMPSPAEKTPVGVPAPSPAQPSSPVVAEAQLCTALSANWHCQPASTPVRQGAIFFFTRIASARDTTVQHRWYAGDRLRQAVDLRIRAGGTRGFRTYSRTTVSPVAGDWRVELRTKDGALLHEERFRVR